MSAAEGECFGYRHWHRATIDDGCPLCRHKNYGTQWYVHGCSSLKKRSRARWHGHETHRNWLPIWMAKCCYELLQTPLEVSFDGLSLIDMLNRVTLNRLCCRHSNAKDRPNCTTSNGINWHPHNFQHWCHRLPYSSSLGRTESRYHAKQIQTSWSKLIKKVLQMDQDDEIQLSCAPHWVHPGYEALKESNTLNIPP